MNKLRVGLVGCGNIGADLCIALKKGTIPAEIVALTDSDESRAKILQRTFDLDAIICDLEKNAATVDFLVECAVGEVTAAVLEAAIRHHTDCLIMSVGGLMNHADLYEKALKKGILVRLPSGALSGLDGVRAAMEAGLHSVTLTTRKPPKGLLGAPYLEENNIDIENLDAPKVIFEGSAYDACKAFPLNVNVAASLSFAGIGPQDTKVVLIADPGITNNIHEVVAEGAFGRLNTVTENMPSPRNAKSSYLASLSACAELRVVARIHAAYVQVPANLASNA